MAIIRGAKLASAPVIYPSQNRSEFMTSVHNVTYGLLRNPIFCGSARGWKPTPEPANKPKIA